MAELKTVVPNLPSAQNIPAGGTVGPYIYYAQNSIALQNAFKGMVTSECPPSTGSGWADGNGLLICTITIQK
jgi:hypothetical protein